MIRNHILLILRFFSKQKGFSAINITGLTIGISCSLLIALYVFDELRYDTFHADAETIYRVSFRSKLQGKVIHTAQSPAVLAERFKALPEVNDVIRLAVWKTFPIRFDNKSFTENYLVLADSNFFRFFSFNLIHGKPEGALSGPRKIIITTSAVKRYFDLDDQTVGEALGKELFLAQGYTVRVSGIAEDPPSWSHFHFTHILSLDSWTELNQSSVFTPQVYTYIKASEPTASIASILHKTLEQRVHEELQTTRSSTHEQYKLADNYVELDLQPLTAIHLHSSLADEIEQNGNIQYVYLFISIAIFIAALACINFINLSTARSAVRAKEVGVRKTVGASSQSLMNQFLIESYFYIIISFLLSYFVLAVILGPFSFFTGKQLPFSMLLNPWALLSAAVLIILIGLLAGSYPAIYLTRFSPIEVLHGKLRQQLRSFGIRNVLVVFQFFISASLIIATFIVYSQLRYVQKMNLGFSKENIINLLHTKNLNGKAADFKKEILALDGVVKASYANRLPPQVDWMSTFRLPDSDKEYMMSVYEMDSDHMETMKFDMAHGRFFSTTNPEDTLAIIINENAMRQLGWTDIEEKYLISEYHREPYKNRKVIGVIRDFHFRSAREPIQPLAVVPGDQPGWEMAIRINGNAQQLMESIQQVWNTYVPDAAFEARLVEHNLANAYATEKKIGLVFLVFTILAIFIACLGLFGLATFTADQRTKEIGVRKVLGANLFSITVLLNKSFLKLVILGNLLAYPLAWWYMSLWLSQFEYHITFSIFYFAITTAITILIAFLSVSYKALKVATDNPVKSLRNE